MPDKITASSFSNGIKLMAFVVPFVISGLTTAVVYAFTLGAFVTEHKDLRKDFDEHIVEQNIRWDKDDISDQEYLETVIRIDEKLKSLKELVKDL